MNYLILDFYCCHNKLPHIYSLKQHKFINSQISSPGTARVSWILCFESHEAKTKLLLGLSSFLETLEVSLLLGLFRLLAKFSSSVCKIKVSISLLTINGGPSLFPRDILWSLHMSLTSQNQQWHIESFSYLGSRWLPHLLHLSSASGHKNFWALKRLRWLNCIHPNYPG